MARFCVLLSVTLLIGITSNSIAQTKKAPSAKPSAPVAQAPTAPKLSAYTEPFDYRGLKLGSTTSDFKKADIAPQTLRAIVNKTEEKGQPVCANEGEKYESLVGLFVSSDFKTLGGTKCVWVETDLSGMRRKAQIQAGRSTTERYEFEFAKAPGDEEPRLFRIVLRPNVNAYEGLLEGLTQKYGAATSATTGSVQNRMGATFDNVITVWENAESKVTLHKYHGTIEVSAVIFELKQHVNFVEAELKELRLKKGPGI